MTLPDALGDIPDLTTEQWCEQYGRYESSLMFLFRPELIEEMERQPLVILGKVMRRGETYYLCIPVSEDDTQPVAVDAFEHNSRGAA